MTTFTLLNLALNPSDSVLYTISKHAESTAIHTTPSFIDDGFNVIALLAFVVSLTAAYFSYKQWAVTDDVKKTIGVNKEIVNQYLPSLIPLICFAKIKAIVVLSYLKLIPFKEGYPEENQLEKISYNTQIVDLLLKNDKTLTSNLLLLYKNLENLKRKVLITNSDVEMSRRHLQNGTISLKTKISDIRIVINGYSEIAGLIRNLMLLIELNEANVSLHKDTELKHEFEKENNKTFIDEVDSEFCSQIDRANEMNKDIPKSNSINNPELDKSSIEKLCRSIDNNGDIFSKIYKERRKVNLNDIIIDDIIKYSQLAPIVKFDA